MNKAERNFYPDVEKINKIEIVPRLLEVICRTTGMGFAAIARVTEEKWIACSVRDEILFGLEPGGELVLETTICHDIRQTQVPVVIDHVAEDSIYATHHTPAMYGFQSYISVPIIRKDGSFFGTLCAIDPKPAKLNSPEITGMFDMFADLISFHLAAIEELALKENELTEEKKNAELREQFIAVLGHDLRNPVGAIYNSSELLLKMQPEGPTTGILNVIQNSSYRVIKMIENIMDFAKGKMGGGIDLQKNSTEPVDKILAQIINELQIIWPDKIIQTSFDLKEKVRFDSTRLSQLFSNLLGNALSYGEEGTPIIITASTDKNIFSLSVANKGKKIREEMLPLLFQPFSRGDVQSGKQGLGLGLYIASEIAIAHGGTLSVTSTNELTTFTFEMKIEA